VEAGATNVGELEDRLSDRFSEFVGFIVNVTLELLPINNRGLNVVVIEYVGCVEPLPIEKPERTTLVKAG
jgi:hypothetical protein